MPAYLRSSVSDFLDLPELSVLGKLQAQYARDGFASQYTEQAKAWGVQIPLLQQALRDLVMRRADAASWTVLLEYPLYRLRKRIDAVLLSGAAIAVIEGKAGERRFKLEDERQVEEYALDLRDFHEGSHTVPLYPILWCTGASHGLPTYASQAIQVAPVQRAGRSDLADVLSRLPDHPAEPFIVAESWDNAAYRPVPNVIEAATSIFAGHDVRSIAQADASNLAEPGEQIIKLILEARESGYNALIFLTGVPGLERLSLDCKWYMMRSRQVRKPRGILFICPGTRLWSRSFEKRWLVTSIGEPVALPMPLPWRRYDELLGLASNTLMTF